MSSSQVMSLSESHFYSYNLSPFSNQSSKISNLEPSTFISLNTHLKNPSLSIKKSQKSRTVAAMSNNLCAPPQETQSFYELLGISESDTLSEIKKAYKQLARKYHPDVSPADQTEQYTQTFIRVQQAYETLSDPQTRASYDRYLSKGLHFAFTRGTYNQESEEKAEWKNRWETQLTELKRKSTNSNNSSWSWGARMRSQKREAF